MAWLVDGCSGRWCCARGRRRKIPFPCFLLFSVFLSSSVVSFYGFGFFVFSVCFCSPTFFRSFFLFSLYPRVSLLFFPARLPLRSSLFIDNKTEQVCLLLVRLQSRNGWSSIEAFGGGWGEERERREGVENFRLLLLLIRGEGGR